MLANDIKMTLNDIDITMRHDKYHLKNRQFANTAVLWSVDRDLFSCIVQVGDIYVLLLILPLVLHSSYVSQK